MQRPCSLPQGPSRCQYQAKVRHVSRVLVFYLHWYTKQIHGVSRLGKAIVVYNRLCKGDVSHTGVNSHNSLGLGERYHHPLRNTYRKITITHPHLPKELRLVFKVKVIHDTLGSKGLVSSELLFGKYPQIRALGIYKLPRPDLTECAKAGEEAGTQILFNNGENLT